MNDTAYKIGEVIEYRVRGEGWLRGWFNGTHVDFGGQQTLLIITEDRTNIARHPKNVRKAPPPYEPTDAELQAAFLAARGFGKVLTDEVLSAVLRAAHEAREA